MQKIKLTIAGRVYPLNVNKDDESQIRESAKSINSMINHFEKGNGLPYPPLALPTICVSPIIHVDVYDLDSGGKVSLAQYRRTILWTQQATCTQT